MDGSCAAGIPLLQRFPAIVENRGVELHYRVYATAAQILIHDLVNLQPANRPESGKYIRFLFAMDYIQSIVGEVGRTDAGFSLSGVKTPNSPKQQQALYAYC